MPAPGLPITSALVERVLSIETANLVSRLEAYTSTPVHVRRFGAATAFAMPGSSVRLHNSVLGVDEQTRAHLPDIEAFYAELGCEGALEIAPGRLSEAFGRALCDRGYAMVEFHAGLVRAVEAEDRQVPLPLRTRVEPVDPEDELAFERFLDVFVEGRGEGPAAKADLRRWRGVEPWRFYVAFVGDEPAAAAVLDVRGDIALNASAATRPALRGRGAQTALIRHRLAEAARLGCELVVGGAYFGTPSMRNHQREGFSTAFTRGIWTRA